MIRIKDREMKVTLDISCDDEKVGKVRRYMLIENKE